MFFIGLFGLQGLFPKCILCVKWLDTVFISLKLFLDIYGPDDTMLFLWVCGDIPIHDKLICFIIKSSFYGFNLMGQAFWTVASANLYFKYYSTE